MLKLWFCFACFSQIRRNFAIPITQPNLFLALQTPVVFVFEPSTALQNDLQPQIHPQSEDVGDIGKLILYLNSQKNFGLVDNSQGSRGFCPSKSMNLIRVVYVYLDVM